MASIIQQRLLHQAHLTLAQWTKQNNKKNKKKNHTALAFITFQIARPKSSHHVLNSFISGVAYFGPDELEV